MSIGNTARDLFGQANDLEAEAADLQADGESKQREGAALRARAKQLRQEANTRDQDSWSTLFKIEVKKALTSEQFDAIIERVRATRAETDRCR